MRIMIYFSFSTDSIIPWIAPSNKCFLFTQFISHLQRKENSCYIMLKEYIFYIIVNFPDGTDILLYSIFTMSLDFLKIRKKQKTEKQKFTIKENVMSEQVKMPVRHFLRRDYLHIFFYSKFLLFVYFSSVFRL